MEQCRHEMDPAWCADCRPAPRRPGTSGPFVWIKPARLFHAPDCAEVLWDTSQAEKPGERVELDAAGVRTLLDEGVLERGCYKCGASAHR